MKRLLANVTIENKKGSVIISKDGNWSSWVIYCPSMRDGFCCGKRCQLDSGGCSSRSRRCFVTWKHLAVSRHTKLRLLNTLVFPVSLYCAETWTIETEHQRRSCRCFWHVGIQGDDKAIADGEVSYCLRGVHKILSTTVSNQRIQQSFAHTVLDLQKTHCPGKRWTTKISRRRPVRLLERWTN